MSSNTSGLFRAINATTQLFGPPVSATPDPYHRFPYMWVLSPMFKLTLPDRTTYPMPIMWPHTAMREYELWLQSISSRGVILNEVGLPHGIEVIRTQTGESSVHYRYNELPPHISRTTQPLEWKPRNDKELPWKTASLDLVASPSGWHANNLVLTDTERSR